MLAVVWKFGFWTKAHQTKALWKKAHQTKALWKKAHQTKAHWKRGEIADENEGKIVISNPSSQQ